MSKRFVISNKINPKMTDSAFYTKGRSGKYETTKFKNLVEDKDIVITMSQAQALAGEIAQAINSDVYILSVDEYDALAVVKTVSGDNSINESKKAFASMNNFVSVFEELNRLYESDEVSEEDINDDDIEEDDEEEVIEIEDDENAAVTDEPKQVILECANCGALVIKDEADIKIDEATDLVNITDECAYCEEVKGYTIIGMLAPYESAEVPVKEGLFDIFKKKDKPQYVVTKPVGNVDIHKNTFVQEAGGVYNYVKFDNAAIFDKKEDAMKFAYAAMNAKKEKNGLEIYSFKIVGGDPEFTYCDEVAPGFRSDLGGSNGAGSKRIFKWDKHAEDVYEDLDTEVVEEGLRRVKKGEQETYRKVTYKDIKKGDYVMENPRDLMDLPLKVTKVKAGSNADDVDIYLSDGTSMEGPSNTPIYIFDSVDIKARKKAAKAYSKNPDAFEYVTDEEGAYLKQVSEGLFSKKIDMKSVNSSNTKIVDAHDLKVGDILVGTCEVDPDDPNYKEIRYYGKNGPRKVKKIDIKGDWATLISKRVGDFMSTAQPFGFEPDFLKFVIYTGPTPDDEELEELFDMNLPDLNVSLDGGTGNNVDVL